MQLLSGLGWWYNWGLSPQASTSTTGPTQEFVAMAWGGQHKHEPLKKYLDDWTPHPSTKHLLGFNEPNLRHQSNLSAAAACALWPEVMSAAKQHGMSLGSPAANHCTPGGSGSQDSNCFQAPEDWFDAFFAQPGCGTDTVDFIATHKCVRRAAAEY
ncbi:glycoside hydrolase family protein [bacterium]|nr:glycoside hydrolase family protein [bacterium]